MAEFAYTTVPGKVPLLLNRIRDVGVPSKVSVSWLKTVGFTSSNDASLISVLKQIELIDASSTPTTSWHAYRGADHSQVLAGLIKRGYAGLFDVYPDANERTQSDIENVFTTKSTAGRQAIGKTYTTFKALCNVADFSLHRESSKADKRVDGSMHEQRGEVQVGFPSVKASFPSMHIDIQVHIAPESSLEQIDQIFKSMAKHLYGAASA